MTSTGEINTPPSLPRESAGRLDVQELETDQRYVTPMSQRGEPSCEEVEGATCGPLKKVPRTQVDVPPPRELTPLRMKRLTSPASSEGTQTSEGPTAWKCQMLEQAFDFCEEAQMAHCQLTSYIPFIDPGT